MKWIKPSGLEITTNDDAETVAYCESLGWKNADEGHEEEPKPERKKPGPKPKAKEESEES